MATISKLNCFGGYGDVIEETPSPAEAMILSSYFDNKFRRDEEFLLNNSTFGFQEHQIPEEIWQKFPEWRLKYKDFDVWRRSDVNDKTIMILAVEGRGTREARMTVLARFIPQPSDTEKPRIQQSVSTLGEMMETLANQMQHYSHPIKRWVGKVITQGFDNKILNYLSVITIFPFPIILMMDIVLNDHNNTYEENVRIISLWRTISLYKVELAEAKARLETS